MKKLLENKQEQEGADGKWKGKRERERERELREQAEKSKLSSPWQAGEPSDACGLRSETEAFSLSDQHIRRKEQ